MLVHGLEHRIANYRGELDGLSAQLNSELNLLDETHRTSMAEQEIRRRFESDQAVTQWDQDREDTWSRRDRITLTSLRSEAARNRELQARHQTQSAEEKSNFKKAREKLDQQYEELKPRPARILERYLEVLQKHRATAEQLVEDYHALMTARSVRIPDHVVPAKPDESLPANAAAAAEAIQSELKGMASHLNDVQKRFIVRFAGSVLPWLAGLIPGVVLGGVMWWGMRDQPAVAIGSTLATLFLGPVILVFSLMPAVKRAFLQPYAALTAGTERVTRLAKYGKQAAETQCRQDEARLLRDYQERYQALDDQHAIRIKQIDDDLARDRKANREQHVGARLQASRDAKSAIVNIDGRKQPEIERLQASHLSEARNALERFSTNQADIDRRIGSLKRNLEHRNRIGTERAASWIETETQRRAEIFPDWDDARWRDGKWGRHSEEDSVRIPIGDFELKIGEEFEHRMPIDFDWLKQGSLIIKPDAEHRLQARDILQNLLARALTTLPMGRLNVTIIDPEGLGRDFGWLMPLADVEPRLVGHRAWTQSSQIAEQLSMLAYQTEDIIQQRLRDRYRNIIEYNTEAGPMAEPLRLLVWANFPFGLEDVSWQALCSILASGAKCGIAVVMTIDPHHPWPPFVDPKKLEQAGLHLSLRQDTRIDDPILGKYPIRLETPPSPELTAKLIEHCTQAAIDASKIEVPFVSIRVEEQEFQSGRSEEGLNVPLGVAGVGRTTCLRLGHGTAQHVLVAGKTGSGKSSLLHTLITSAALKYSPEQLRMVLLDFKKGVEFQVYAQAKLAHAEIIGIESRREFGLSALEYLDRVMQRRGEMFREAGVQDVPGWVRKRPDQAMPRILVVVDEFQEMFIEDDKLSQQAAMLLDRIVRQGRSFGIHVVLASQTIGGSYSLPRTTLAQMAVRIALQCDSGDAMMILSEDNMAATRLRHSGQAIYNDAGGRIESNQPFQVAYLRSNDQRIELEKIPKNLRPNDPSTDLLGRQIIFEGYKPAVWSEEDVRRGLRMQPPVENGAIRLVLGESLSIEPTIARSLGRQSGRNIVVVGSDPQPAANLIATLVRGWKIDELLVEPELIYFDGSRAEDGKLQGLRQALESDRLYGGPLQVVDPRGIDEAVAELHRELVLRMENPDDAHKTKLIVVAGLGRFRELRKNEEFAFGMKASDQPATDEAFSKLLREGPNVGLFTMIWADSWGTLSRFVPRQGLRDLEVRILMPMSANDSNQLIDSSTANKLEAHALIYYDEADGKIVKFRPYQFDR
jgi:hypothetical protein